MRRKTVAQSTNGAPASLPGKAADAGSARAEAERYTRLAASRAGGSSVFDDEVISWLGQRIALLDAYAGDGPKAGHALAPVGWTHGDFQYRNVLWAAGRVAGILDWDKLRVRTLGEEIVRTATLQFGGEHGWLDLAKVAQFAGGYRCVVPISADELADAVHRLWWKRLTDFWQLDFHYGRGDHSCDHLFVSGERFFALVDTAPGRRVGRLRMRDGGHVPRADLETDHGAYAIAAIRCGYGGADLFQ